MSNLRTALFLVEDFLIAEGLSSHLTKNKIFDSISITNNIKDFEKLILTLNPNLVVISTHNLFFKIETAIAFVSITSQSELVVIGSSTDKNEFEIYRQLGVKGFLLNQSDSKEILDCFEAITKNKTFIAKNFYLDQTSGIKTNNSEDVFKTLNISEREIEIIKLIAQGLINKEIADKLFLSTHTVNTHRKNIMQKLGINNTAGIVLFAVKEHIISPNEFLFQ